MVKDEMDRIYRQMPLGNIPWNIEVPPKALLELVDGGVVRPCRALDLGCGAGNYAIYLASKGFKVTGIDVSAAAIEIARAAAVSKGVKSEFIVADVLGGLSEVDGTFDFAYDWELLHHIMPQQRAKYVDNVHRLLSSRGRYLSVCFSEKDPQFGGKGKRRETPLGTVLYFSSEDEIKSLFSPHFSIKELKTMEIEGTTAPHMAVYAFMEKK